MDKKQILKEYVQTAIDLDYDFDRTNKLFPEIDSLLAGVPSSMREGHRQALHQTLKEYVQTSLDVKFDFDKVNELFPEFFPELKKKESGLDGGEAQTTATSPSQPSVEPSVSSTDEPPRPSTGKPGYTSEEARKAAERDNWDVLGDYVLNASRWISIPGVISESVSAISEGEIPFIRKINEGTLLLGDEKYTKPKYTNYSFGSAEPLIKQLEKSSIVNAEKWIEEYKNSEEFSQLVSDGEVRIKEIDKEVASLTEAAMKTVDASRARSLTNRAEQLTQERESLTEEGILQSKFQSDFVPNQKQKVLDEIPEEYRNDPVFLENLSDRFYYESQLPLDLDGNNVFNDVPWLEGAAKSFESGLRNITDVVEYTATYAAITASPLPKIASDEIMSQKRSETNERNERIAASTAQFTLGITDSIANGDYSNAAKQLVNGTASSIPLIALSAATGGVGGTAAIATSALVNGWVSGVGTYVQIRDLKDDDGNEIYGEEGALGYAFSSAAAEGVFSLVGSHISKLAAGQKTFLTSKDLFNTGLRAQYGGVSPMLKSYVKGALKRKGIAFAEEGITEFSTEFANQVIESLARKDGKKFSLKEAFNTSLDAFLQGGAAGLVFDSFGSIQGNGIKETSVAFANSQDSFYIENITPIDNAIYLLSNALEMEANVETKALISQQIEDLNKKREVIVNERSTYFQALFVQDNKLFQEVAKTNNEIAKARLELRKAENSGNQTAIDAAKNKVKGLIESKSKLLPDVIDMTPEIAKKISDRKIDEKTKRYERAEQDALADLESLESIRESVMESGNQNRIDSYERAVESARNRVEEISSKKSDVESIMDRVFEARKAFNEMSPSDRSDSEFYNNVKKDLVDAENQLFEALNIDSFGSTSADVDSFLNEGATETNIPTRDKAWDDSKKASLPSYFQSAEQLQEVLNSGVWGMLTAENPMRSRLSEEENARKNEQALEWLRGKGYNPIQIFGKYENSESSFFVEGLTVEHALEFASAENFNQESVAHSDGMFYQNGDFNPRQPGSSTGGNPTDFYSTTNVNGELVDFQIDYDFDTRIDSDGNKVEKVDTSTVEGKREKIQQIVNDKSGKDHVTITTNSDGSINLPQDLLGLSDSEMKALNDYIKGVQKSTGQPVTIVIGKKGQSLSGKMSDVFDDGWNGVYYEGVVFVDPDNFGEDRGARVLFEELMHSTHSDLLKNLDPDLKRKITLEFIQIIGKNKDLLTSFSEKSLLYALVRINPSFSSLGDIDSIRETLNGLEEGDPNVELAKRLLSLHEMSMDGKADAKTFAEILSKDPVLFDESITEVMSETLSNPGRYKELSFKAKNLLQRILNLFGLGSATPKLDDIKSAQDLINGIQAMAKGRAVKGFEKPSSEAFSIAGLPPKLRSLNGFSKAQWLELNPGSEFMSVDALPDGPFEVSYLITERLYRGGENETTVTRKFNNREHFINWWKKTNIIPDTQFSGPQNLGTLTGSEAKDRDTKSVFSLFKIDGKMIDVTRLEQMYLNRPAEAKGGFFIKGKGALQFSYNRAFEDLKLAYEDGVLTKKQYYNYLGGLKRQIEGLSKQGDEYVKDNQYWQSVEKIKEIHVETIESAFSDIRKRGNESIQPRLGIEKDGNKIKRTEKGYFPDFQTYKAWKEQLDGPSFSYGVSKTEGYDSRVESTKTKIINEAKEIGVDIDPKKIDNQAKAMAAAEIIQETYPDLPAEERAKRVFLLDSKALKDDGIDWEINKQFTGELTKFIDNEFSKRRISSQGWDAIYTAIHAMTSNGQRESQNTAATILIFRSMVNHFEKTGRLEIPDYVTKHRDVKGLIARFSNFESHVENLNSYLNRKAESGNNSFYNPETKLINGNALRAAMLGEGSRKGKSQIQDVFGRTSDAAKLGAYQSALMGNLNSMVIDSHTIETASIYTGGIKTPLTSTAIDNAFSKMKSLLDPPPATLSEGFNRLMEMKKKKGLDRGKRERICDVLNTLTQKNYDKNKKAIEAYSETIKYISENTSESEASDFGFDIYDGAGSLKPEYVGPNGQFRIPEFYVHQVMFTQNQVRKTGKTTSPGSELKLYNDGNKAIEIEIPDTQSALALEQMAETPKTGIVNSSEFESFSIKPTSTTEVYTGASFETDPDILNRLRGLNGVLSETLSISGELSEINSKKLIGGLVPVAWDPFSQNKPMMTENGIFIESADTIIKHGDKYYVKGNIKIANEASSRNVPSEKINEITNEQLKAVERTLGPIARKLGTSAESVFQNLNKETKEAVLRRDKGVLEGISYSIAGKRIRRTAGKAAARFPGIKQDILNNPENYITPQNLQAVKDRLESLSEADLFDLMRDDVLGRLQNRNDDTGALAGAELIKRAIDRGDMDSVPELIEDLAKIGTSAGRILRHFRELKLQDPVRSTMSFIEAEVRRAGNTLTDAQKQKMNDILARMFKNRDEYNDLVRRSQNGENLEAELKKAATDMFNIEKELSTFANSVVERGWGDISKMLIQGNLLAPISHATNIGSNLINLIGNTFVNSIAIPVERLSGMLGMQVEYKRSYSFMAHLHAWKGFAMGTAEAMNTMFTGKNYDTSSEWSMQRGFMPVQSLLSAMSKEDLPLNEKGVPSLSQRMKLWVQATLGTPAEINFRLLALGDIPFKRFAEQKELYNIGKSKGLSGDALSKFMKNPDKKSADIARREGRKLTFQEETTASEFTNQSVRYIEKVIGTGLGYTVGDKIVDPDQAARFIMATAVPYRTTPANLLHETLTYVAPPYAIARIAAGVRRKDARAVSENFGKMVVGSALTVTAAMLIKEGLMSAPLDWEEDEEKNIAYDQFPPGSINISGLQRFINGEDPSKQPDDYFVSYEKLGIPGSVMGAVAKGVTREELNSIEYDQMNFPHKMFLTAVGINPAAGISHMMDQSFMQGMQTLVSTMASSVGTDDFSRSLERWVSSFFKASTSVVLPNTLSALNRANREYMPDMRVTKDMSASERILKQLEYVIKDRTFNTSEIPVRIDWKGNPVKQTPTGASSIAYQLFDITKARQAESDPVSNEIYRLWDATGILTEAVGTPGYAQKRAFTPPKPGGLSKKEQRAIDKLPRKYTFLDDAEFLDSKLFLNTTELNSLMELSGKHRYNKIQEFMKSDGYKKMSDEDRVEAINNIDKKYVNKIEMDGDDLMPHSKAILDYMQDEYEEYKED